MSYRNKDELISVEHLKFTYPELLSQNVLDIESWSVSRNQNVLLIGGSGSGKSTLLKLLSGLLVPDSGSIFVAGNSLHTMNNRQRDRFRAMQIGYVAQSFNLVPYLSAVDNIKLAHYFAQSSNNKGSDIDIGNLLLSLNLAPDHWNKPINQLSIGQQQRVAIARAIVNKPMLLIADEPTSSLDQDNRDNFMSLLMATAVSHDMTLVFVSHDLSMGKLFDRVDVMREINGAET